jgi:hypothetical protein
MTDKAKDLSNFVPDPRKSHGGVAIADEDGQSLVIRVAGGGENNKAKTIVDVLRNVERWIIAYMGAGFCAIQPSERNSEANTKGKHGVMDVNGVAERRYFTGGGARRFFWLCLDAAGRPGMTHWQLQQACQLMISKMDEIMMSENMNLESACIEAMERHSLLSLLQHSGLAQAVSADEPEAGSRPKSKRSGKAAAKTVNGDSESPSKRNRANGDGGGGSWRVQWDDDGNEVRMPHARTCS